MWRDYYSGIFNWILSVVPPIAFAANDISQNGFTARWSPVVNAEKYLIDVATDNSFSNMVTGYQAKEVVGDTSLTVTGLRSNTSYHYRVRVVVGGRESDNSNIIEVTTALAPMSIYPNPTDGTCYVNLGQINNVEIQVLDVTGKILQKHLVNGTDTYRLTFKNKGVYLIRVIGSEKVGNFKVIVR
jgi:hypothetical protein